MKVNSQKIQELTHCPSDTCSCFNSWFYYLCLTVSFLPVQWNCCKNVVSFEICIIVCMLVCTAFWFNTHALHPKILFSDISVTDLSKGRKRSCPYSWPLSAETYRLAAGGASLYPWPSGKASRWLVSSATKIKFQSIKMKSACFSSAAFWASLIWTFLEDLWSLVICPNAYRYFIQWSVNTKRYWCP